MGDDEKTPENSFVCEYCAEHKFDGEMCVLSMTRFYAGLSCMECAERHYPKQLEIAVKERLESERNAVRYPFR